MLRAAAGDVFRFPWPSQILSVALPGGPRFTELIFHGFRFVRSSFPQSSRSLTPPFYQLESRPENYSVSITVSYDCGFVATIEQHLGSAGIWGILKEKLSCPTILPCVRTEEVLSATLLNFKCDLCWKKKTS